MASAQKFSMAPISNRSSPKSFQCRQCERKFSRAEHRCRHELSHNPERPWGCTQCTSTFVRRDLLLRHERTVHKPNSKDLQSKMKMRTSIGAHRGNTLGTIPTLTSSDSIVGTDSTPGSERTGVGIGLLSQGLSMNISDTQSTQRISPLTMTTLSGSYGPTRDQGKRDVQNIHAPSALNSTTLELDHHMTMQIPTEPGLQSTTAHYETPRQFSPEMKLGDHMTQLNNGTPRVTQFSEVDTAHAASLSNQAAERFTHSLKRPLPICESSKTDQYASRQRTHSDLSHSGGFGASTAAHTQLVEQLIFQPDDITSFKRVDSHLPVSETSALSRHADSLLSFDNRPAAHVPSAAGFQGLDNASKFDIQPLSSARVQPQYPQHYDTSRAGPHTTRPPDLSIPGSANSLVSSILRQDSSEVHLPYAPAPSLTASFNVKNITGSLSPHPSPKFAQVSLDLTRLQLNRYIAAYFNLFHPIIPMLHIQSFDCEKAPLRLILAICSIGATLCRELAIAELLTYNARLHLDKIMCLDISQSDALAHAQCLVITSLYAAFSGSSSQLTSVTTSNQYLLNLVEGLVNIGNILSRADTDPNVYPWQQWIEDQKIIRVYYCSIVAVTTLNILYNFSNKSILDTLPEKLPLPCSEELWNGSFGNEELWRRHLLSDSAKTPAISVGQLMALLKEIGSAESTETWNPGISFPALNQFSVRILGNLMLASAAELPRKSTHEHYDKSAVSSRERKMESLREQMKFWRLASARNYFLGRGHTSLLSSSNGPILDMFCQLELSTNHDITRASLFLQALRSQQHPMIPLSHVLLGIAKLRLVLDMTSIRESLQHHDVYQISEAARVCVANDINAQVLDDLFSAVTACFEVMRVPCVLGIPMTQNYLASPVGETFIGHCLILGFETVVALLIWCYCVEERLKPHSSEKLSDRVKMAYKWIEQTCLDAGHQKIYGSLAPALAEIGASSYEDIKAWQICAIMAASLRQIGEVFASSGSFSTVFTSNHVHHDTGSEYLPYA